MSAAADSRFMTLALRLAAQGRGGVGTNPLVGAVVVRHGRIVGRGFHARYGGPHAEAVALADAGDDAKGATLYVTLEPCSHLGKTPPCTRMIAASGIRNVVFAGSDPHERGAGVRELKRFGISARGGVLAAQARELNREFHTRIRTGRPFVTLKLATTLDGRIADYRGFSKWISSAAARAWTRSMRRTVDAVMVGAGTAAADDPRLTAPGPGEGPLKIIVDARASLKPSARVFRRGRVLVAVGAQAPAAQVGALRLAGARIVACPAVRGRLDLRFLLRDLGKAGVGAILCEGGGELAGSLIAGRLVDRVVMVLSSKLLGGSRSVAAVGGPDRPLGRALALTHVERFRVGADTVVTGLAG